MQDCRTLTRWLRTLSWVVTGTSIGVASASLVGLCLMAVVP